MSMWIDAARRPPCGLPALLMVGLLALAGPAAAGEAEAENAAQQETAAGSRDSCSGGRATRSESADYGIGRARRATCTTS